MKVICLDNTPLYYTDFNDSLSKLIVGKEYTVIEESEGGYLLLGIKSSHPTGEYAKQHFKEMKNYRLNKTSPSINKFIEEYAKEKGVRIVNTTDYNLYCIYNGFLTSCNVAFQADIIGIDDFLNEIDKLAIPTLTMGNIKAEMKHDGVHFGNKTLSHSQMDELIHWYRMNSLK